jgi:hypothetical protein
MQTKSRYEVVADLEEQKRNLIRERDSLDKVLLSKKKELKELKREIEDKEEEKQKRRKYQKQKYEQINNNFKAKPIEERIKIGENKIKELLAEPIENLLKSNIAKAKISKIIGLTSEKMFQKQKVYILPNINNITK